MKLKSLTYDVSRCSARFDFDPDAKWCERRHTCQRFKAWSEWDAAAEIQDYKGIAVTMAREDCGIKIELEKQE